MTVAAGLQIAINIVADKRNQLEPGREFEILNLLIGDLDEARRRALTAEKTKAFLEQPDPTD